MISIGINKSNDWMLFIKKSPRLFPRGLIILKYLYKLEVLVIYGVICALKIKLLKLSN